MPSCSPIQKQERVNEAADIQPGDYVVHVEHGVGKYLGIVETKSGEMSMEVLSIEYAKGDKVYLPVTQAHLLTRYKSMGKQRPAYIHSEDGSGEMTARMPNKVHMISPSNS